MTPIEIIVRREIQRAGALSFARFMDLALYCPELGYYDRFPHTIGAAGDYYTSVSVGPLFGRLLAAQFALWLRSCEVESCQIVEGGAHNGQLARDILDWLQQHHKALYDRLEYWIVDPSKRRRQWQQTTLGSLTAKVRWIDSWSDVGSNGIRGIVFANELLDALPAHRVGWDRTRQCWFEWGVGLRENHLAWTRLPLAGPHAACVSPDLPSELRGHLPDGFTTEVCPAAAAWWQQAARSLRQGWLIALDYGLRAHEFLDPGRAHGTARAYHRHRLGTDLLARPGEQDLTAQVNFTAIETAGLEAGLQTEVWTTQERFLTRILDRAVRERLPGFDWSAAEMRQFRTLTHPDHLGLRHHALVQSTGMSMP